MMVVERLSSQAKRLKDWLALLGKGERDTEGQREKGEFDYKDSQLLGKEGKESSLLSSL